MHASPSSDRASAPARPVNPVLLDALERARVQVERDWNLILPDAPSREEAMAQLARLCGGVAEVAAGAAPEGLPRGVLARRLVELIRRHLLEELEGVPGPEALAFLGAVERVHQFVEPDWAGHFADRLSGPDGMELVVEVAHDLRSPLTSILFLAETLQRARSGPINQIQERQLGLIYSAAFGLSSMASDVIELARGGDRLVDLDPTPFSILDILESVRDIVQPIAEEKGLEVRLTWPPIDFRIGHPVALSRVLLNLTTNALKFTSEGFVEVLVEAGEGDEVHFSVRDTGRGIPSESLILMFEPFRRRRGQSDYAFSGSGLGLSICRKLVEAMGASLQVDTGPDEGTRFYFSLHLPPASMQNFGPLAP
ncbi:MAG TPA: HAMP domain-containing sensor histidine kinase [Gemmatimonadales bacterium]|nr:HAMP domain-containing sensor histidine kinase [Gemmatimonadales bacterium]